MKLSQSFIAVTDVGMGKRLTLSASSKDANSAQQKPALTSDGSFSNPGWDESLAEARIENPMRLSMANAAGGSGS